MHISIYIYIYAYHQIPVTCIHIGTYQAHTAIKNGENHPAFRPDPYHAPMRTKPNKNSQKSPQLCCITVN